MYAWEMGCDGDRFMKASVVMMTYNHEKFIAQAVESVMTQETTFDYELIVGDDNSTDHTREIVQDLCSRYPGRIRLLPATENMGLVRNHARTYQACLGQYVAVLDGDDYWTTRDKLQKTVAFLDNHPDHTICFHSATLVWEDGSQESSVFRPPGGKDTYTLEDLLEENFIASCAVVYRRGVVGTLPSWYFTMPVEDWPQHILHAQQGKIGYVDEPMGAYRQHADSVYSKRSQIDKLVVAVETLKHFRSVLNNTHRHAINGSLSQCYYRLSHACCDDGDWAQARCWARRCLWTSRLSGRIPVATLVKTLLKTHVRTLYSWCKALLPK